MFKIESYITPIILSYVDKYVKNIRPEDSQVSLWGGDVVFQNLDLKLDVLEEELQLPFNFLSGHIHELSIHVPWTKIASEPIAITINTIEFVLKLRDSDNRSVPKKEYKKKLARSDEAPPPGYMATLINKIANNISVKCHNVILKYVEEDIVVSMNIQQLSVESADINWNPAFIDISPTKVALRKIINVVDLTICLDKRNSAGKIEICQEPILYRSSLQARMLRRYNISSFDRSSITRLDVHTKFLDMNISSQQFPMLMRLMNLALALKQGKIKSETNLRTGGESANDEENLDNQQSYLSWAWNLLPSIFPEENEGENSDEHEFHVLHTGFYADHVRIVFKTQEFIGDTIVSTTRKIKYNPIIRIDFKNVYCETTICGMRWFNMSCGISQITIQSLEDCPCGNKQNVSEIFESFNEELSEELHIKRSFFDEKFLDSQKYNINWNNHLETFTDTHMLKRTPALVIDVLHEIEIPEDIRTSEFGSDLEFSNLSEKYMQRFFVGPFKAKISADAIHRIKTLVSYKDIYEYPPYYEEKPMLQLSQLPPPSAEDYDALMSEIPLKTVQIVILKPVIELHLFNHGKLSPNTRKRSVIKPQTQSNPFLIGEFDRFESKMITPLYPNRLVHTTCQLPQPPAKLFDNCFINISGNIQSFKMKIIHNDLEAFIVHPTNIKHHHKFLLLPELWPDNELSKIEHTCSVKQLKLNMNPAQQIVFVSILQSLASWKYDKFEENNLLSDVFDKNLPIIEIIINGVLLKQVKMDKTNVYRLTLRTLQSFSFVDTEVNQKSMIVMWPDTNCDEDALTIVVQLPLSISKMEHASIVYGRFLELGLNLDPNFYNFLCYQQGTCEVPPYHISTSPRKSVEKIPKRSSLPITSVNSSSDKDCLTFSRSESEVKSEPPDYSFWKLISRKLIFHLEIKHFTFYFPTKAICIPNLSFISKTSNNDILILKLPQTSINSAFKPANINHSINKFPIILPRSVWSSDKDNLPWSISLSNLSCSTIQNEELIEFIEATTTNITLALTYNENVEVDDGTPISACFHVDTSPFKMNLFKDQLLLINNTIKMLYSLPFLEQPHEIVKKEHQFIEISQLSNSSQTAADLKEFLDMTQNSTNTEDTLMIVNKGDKFSNLSIWLQWTFSKISIYCFSSEIQSKSNKIVLEFEDVIYSLDKQDIYLKIKTKIGGMNGQCFVFNQDQDSWVKNEALSFNIQSDVNVSDKASIDTFFDLTITKAETMNVHTKWGTTKKTRNQNETLVEVIVKMQQIDMRLDLDLLSNFITIFTVFDRNNESESTSNVLAVTDLPLLHFESKGVRLFIPSDKSVYILKVSNITISHNIENPICRAPLRPDVYTKAAQMRILNVPGSKIEDRQYELLLKDISLSTANWNDVLEYIREQSSSATHHDNPAFEWNNLQDIQKMSFFDINTIFKEFNFSAIYAPCIIFKNVLICSQALELNCMSDLVFNVDTSQLVLAECILRKFQHISVLMNSTVPRKSPSKTSLVEYNPTLFRSNSSISQPKALKIEDDSGVESLKHSSNRKSFHIQNKTDENNQVIPYEICFVGGYFKFNVYHKKNKGDPAKTILKVDLVQPNALVSLNLLEKVVQISLFDVTIMIEDSLINTLSGEPDSLGIPQPILKAKFVNSLTKHNELNIDFKRPIQFTLSHSKIESLLKIKKIMNEIFSVRNNSNVENMKPVIIKNKFKLIKSNLYDIQLYNINLSQTVFHFKDDLYNFKASLSSINSSLKVQDRPEKISVSVQLDEFVLSEKAFVIIHPFSFDMQSVLSQEYWKKDPVIQVKIIAGYLQIDLNPYNIIGWNKMMALFNEVFVKNCPSVAKESETCGKIPEKIELIQLPTPKYGKKMGKPVNEEHYQDDLRAGAFQFVETNKSKELPLPYQIQIINKAVGIVCWRYPQPRALSKVQVFPVPMNSSKSVNIQCKLEYFSEIYSTFFELCEFTLSENEKLNLKLPNQKISSAIWRILMTQNVVSDGSDNEDNDDYEEKSLITNITDVLKDTYLSTTQRIVNLPYRLHPKIFVACMRIDSCFNSNLIPNIEMTFDVKPIQINLFNIINYQQHQLPEIFENFRFCKDTLESKSHKFLILHANKFSFYGAFYDNMDVCIKCDLNLNCELLDYSYFNFESILDLLNVKILARFENNNLIDLNVITEDILLRYGPCFGHTLMVADRLWKQIFDSEDKKCIIYGKYIICNNTNTEIRFGQLGTNETIYLASKEMCQYGFRSHKHPQLIQLYVGNQSLSTASFSVTKDGVKHIPIISGDEDDDRIFIVKIKNISNLQKKITINGQIYVYNMTSQALRIHYRHYKVKEIEDDEKNYISSHFVLEENSSANVFGTANSDSHQVMRMAVSNEKRGWSGDIPLKEMTNGSKPYLVKIPTSLTKEGYVSYWVRIVRENVETNIDDKKQKVLVIIWPLFMLRSMLTVHTTAHEQKIDRTFSIFGQGEKRQLIISGTNVDEHELLFRMNFNSPYGEDKRKALLSYKLIDGKTFFQHPDKYKSIEKAIEVLEKSPPVNWPCSREEELRWCRDNAMQEVTLPIYNCSAAQEMSCSLMLNIAPWCLFTNSLGCQIKLKNSTNDDSCIIEPNNIVMPFYIDKAFTIELNIDAWLQSELIYINPDVKRTTSNSYVLVEEGDIELNIQSQYGIFKLILSSMNENNIRVIILNSQFIVSNFSSYDLKCWSFAILSNEKLDQIKTENTGTHVACYNLPKNVKNCQNQKGSSIAMFNNLSKKKNKIKFNSNFNFFITFYQNNGTEFACPINVNKSTTRKSFCVHHNDKFIPLSLSIILHQSSKYISIYDDKSPSITVENRTDFNIYVAQSDSLNLTKAPIAVSECPDNNFLWHQTVPSKQQIYYTPPYFDNAFPELADVEIGLIFACVSGSAIRWSHPVNIDENKNIFLNIPLYGDLKLAVNLKNKTTDILIDYISQDSEFSAKDIRTRLLNPTVRDPLTDPATSSRDVYTTPLSSPISSKLSHENIEINAAEDAAKNISVKSFFKNINVTLFNDKEDKHCIKTDLISFSFDQIGFELSNNLHNQMRLNLSNIQIDNQLHSAGEYDFPVILCSEDHETKIKINTLPSQYDLDEILMRLADTSLCSIVADLDSESVHSIESLKLKINPIRAYIEDTYINILLDYLVECLPINLLYEEEKKLERVKCTPGEVLIPILIVQQSSYLAEPMKFKFIKIDPLHVLLSVHTCMRLYIALDHSPLDFSEFERRNIRTLPMKFGNSVGMHYLSGAIFGGGWVIGSLEILGSPSGLARSVTSGLRDFVSLPFHGLFRGPWGFLVGVTQGSASLIKNVTAGTVNSVTKLATSVARNLDRLTLDSEHVQRTDAIRRRRPQGMTDGFAQGLTGLGISILGAVGGLAHHPMQARSTVEVMTGVGKGIVGAFAKPISGAAELVALTGQGMLHSVGYNTMPTPKSNYAIIQRVVPISYKIMWDPQTICDGSLLVTFQATLACKNSYKMILIGVYTKTLLILDVENNQLLEVLDINTIYPTVDASDSTQVILKVRPELPPPTIDYTNHYPVSSRTFQYVQDSLIQLPKSKSGVSLQILKATLTTVETASDINDESEAIPEKPSEPVVLDNDGKLVIEEDDNERKLLFYLDENLAKYLVKYVNLLKRNNSSTIVFLPFDLQ